MQPTGTQRIVKIRRDYNSWVADETMEDYALRFTPKSFRKWSASPMSMAKVLLGCRRPSMSGYWVIPAKSAI